MVTADRQPDQDPSRWDDHVLVYERVFEPFSASFADVAIAALGLAPGARCLDVGCGSGGAALRLAEMGMGVCAVDASAAMIERVKARAQATGVAIEAHVMDGQALAMVDNAFDAALSVFGVILFPDAIAGLRELRRVVKPGGRVAVVTWTQPQHYELAAELRAAIGAVRPDAATAPLPAQLRFRERDAFETLFREAGFADVVVDTCTAAVNAPSARWLAEHLAFAPGMAAMLKGLGDDSPKVLERFVARLESVQGTGPIALKGTAFIGTSQVTDTV
jgi:ubiquinone/menaquinone biosynthesis C-methylase UbiE